MSFNFDVNEQISKLPEQWQPWANIALLIGVLIFLIFSFLRWRQKSGNGKSKTGQTTEINKGVAIKGGKNNQYNVEMTINNGADTEAIIEAVERILFEQEQAGNPLLSDREQAAKIAELSTELELPDQLVVAFLKNILNRDIPRDQWKDALFEAKTAFDNAQRELEELRAKAGIDDEIKDALEAAQRALDTDGEINLQAAETALREARQIWLSQLDQRRDEEDKLILHILITEAELATANFAHDRAADLWEKAAAYEAEADKLFMLDRAGKAWKKAGSLARQERVYQTMFETAKRLAASDPAHTGWQRDLSVSYERLALNADALGNTAQPLWQLACTILQDLDKAGKLAPKDRPALEEICQRASVG